MGYTLNEEGFMTSWKIRQYGVLINIKDLPRLPRLPKSPLDWSTNQQKRFEEAIDFAYQHELSEISWLDERLSKRKPDKERSQKNENL